MTATPTLPIDAFALEEVDSEDIPEASTKDPVWQQVLRSSVTCFQPAVNVVETCTTTAYKSCVANEREEFEFQLPAILKDIKGGGHKVRHPALLSLYRLTDREHKQNRTPPVCTTKFETIQTLSLCLRIGDAKEADPKDRRQALLILNNLCIPTENKAAILFGEPATPLLTALLAVIRARVPESYLAVVTLLNLSYLQDEHAKSMLFNFIPDHDNSGEGAASRYSVKAPIEDSYSVIRTMESLLKDSVSYVRNKQVNSVEQQCCRWSLNFIRNLVTLPDNCLAVGTKTKIPAYAAECLAAADTSNLARWTRDSLEDAALMLLINVCQTQEGLSAIVSRKPLTDQIMAVCETLELKQGIHSKRGAALLELLDEATATRSVGYSV